MLTRKRRTKLSLIAIAAVLAGCGSSGSSGASASAYAHALCSAISPFQKDVASRLTALNASSIKSAAEGRTALVGFLDAVATDTDHAAAQLKAVGTPNVKNGKAIATAVIDTFTQLKSALVRASTRAGTLPTNSPTAFRDASDALSNSVRTSLSSVGAGLGALTSPDLDKAAAADPTCKSIETG